MTRRPSEESTQAMADALSDNSDTGKKEPVARKRRSEMGSLTERAYKALKKEILSNRLRPGQPLSKKRLLRELGLSQTPLRDAVLRLQKEGLIEIKPRLGTFVSHLNLTQIQDMYETRRILEGAAARLSAQRIPTERLAAVEEALRSQPLEGEIDYAALSEAGQRLHALIIESCGNRVLTDMIQSLQDHFTRFRTLSLRIPDKILSSHREHLEILEALKKGDGLLAEDLVHRHFDNAARYLLQSLLKRRHQDGDLQVTVLLAEE